MRIHLRQNRNAKVESFGSLPAQVYNKGSYWNSHRLSSAGNQTRRNQLCKNQLRKSLSRTLPQIHSCRQRKEHCKLPRHMQRIFLFDSEAMKEGIRVLNQHRLENGRYILTDSKSVPAFKVGDVGVENKWITLYAYMIQKI